MEQATHSKLRVVGGNVRVGNDHEKLSGHLLSLGVRNQKGESPATPAWPQ